MNEDRYEFVSDDGAHRWFRDTATGELVDANAIKLEDPPLFGLDKCRAEASRGGWKVTVEGFATNQEAEALATCLVTRLAEVGPERTLDALKDESGQNGTHQDRIKTPATKRMSRREAHTDDR